MAMTQQPYLLFDLNHSLYGIAADFVQEIFFLPALTDLAESQPDVAGILSLRGEILTVIDLNQRLGKPHYPFTLNHSVIVVNWQNHRLGIIVNLVHGVEAIESADISNHFTNGSGLHKGAGDCHLLIGLAQHQEQIIPLLNPEALIKGRSLLVQSVPDVLNLESNGFSRQNSEQNGEQTSAYTVQPSNQPRNPQILEPSQEFMAEFSPHEQEVLYERAQSLRHAPEGDSSSGLLPLAVVGLQGEYFGLNLERIHEFTEIHQITPIPCCPPHIVGNMNLRGEILTLIDVSHVLQLKGEQSPAENVTARNQQAVVVRIDKLVAGVTVDTVHDVVYLHSSDISPVPAAVHAMNEDFIRGVASYQDKQMSILDLSKILSSDNLVVNESV
jgi:purine-binding chemotaxis protein CheW